MASEFHFLDVNPNPSHLQSFWKAKSGALALSPFLSKEQREMRRTLCARVLLSKQQPEFCFFYAHHHLHHPSAIPCSFFSAAVGVYSTITTPFSALVLYIIITPTHTHTRTRLR